MNGLADAVGLSPLLLILGLAALASLAITPLTVLAARRLGVLDRPGGYKAHGQPVPLLGGLAVAAGMLLPLVLLGLNEAMAFVAAFVPLVCGLAILIVAGLIDDARGLSPRHKFLWQVSAAALAASATSSAGVRLELFLDWGVVPISLLTILWIVAVTNAVNFLDNMNGLCAGLGVVIAALLALYNVRSGAESVALAAAALCGASLGFLPFNWPRARIFLGDTGSMAIGFTLATLSVMGVYTTNAQVPLLAVLTPVFMLAVPIADAVIVVLLRLRDGWVPWRGDRRHISHRLVRRGIKPSLAVVVVWLSTAACGLAALIIPVVTLQEAPLLIALVVFVIAALFLAAGSKGLE